MSLLKKVAQVEHEAAAFGFSWETPLQIMDQIQSECSEVDEHLKNESKDSDSLQEEIGDLLHAVFSLCVFCNFDPEKTLQLAVDKFARRLNAVKAIAHERQLPDLQKQPFDELMAIWQQAKERVG